MANDWQEDELVLTLHLYCRTPFGKLHKTNPDIIQLANIIGRSPSAVALKAVNFASLDESIPQKGMRNASNADRVLWNRFMKNSTDVAEKAEELYENRVTKPDAATPINQISEPKIPTGETETIREIKARRVQSFFRRTVLQSYNNRCAISGLAIPQLLVASHIIPWSVDASRRADPTNGIALNGLYDKAFDRHLISFDEDFRLVLSDSIKAKKEDQAIKDYFIKIEGKTLEMPYRFLPDKAALKMHRNKKYFNLLKEFKMDKIKVLHIGDIHYPDNKDRHSIDIKDKGVSSDFLKTISPNCFNKVSMQIIEVIKKYDLDMILFSGDLTSRGNLEQYDLCVKYLTDLLSKESIGKKIEIHVVPGNHDIDRKSLEKFEPFSTSWKNQGLDILVPYDVRTTLISKNQSKLKIASLNTCLGCGEFRGYPEKIKNEISALLEKANLEDKAQFNIFGESLDTPAASQNDILKIESIINQCKEDNSIPLILGHHGILPQSIIRVDVYTEMINGGYIRTMLNSCEHPVVYCHGHIHDDPVEVIMQPQYESSMLISISAPAFTDGFNIIEFDYLENGTPLGCTIKTFKIRNYSGLKLDREIRVPLKKPDSLEKYSDKNLEAAFKMLPPDLIFYKDLINDWNAENPGVDLKSILITLEWLGILVIDNREKSESKWIIRRIGI